MKQVVVGTFQAGYENIQLVLRSGTGGEFFFLPDGEGCPRVKVGADGTWFQVFHWALHEIYEAVLARERARFGPSIATANNHDSYIFVMDHTKFSEVTARVADFMVAAMPALGKAFKGWHKKEVITLGSKAKPGREAKKPKGGKK